MSWLQQLYETYEQCSKVPEFTTGEKLLLPVYHTTASAHIEIIIDPQGNFLDVRIVTGINTIIPATEKSLTGRTSGCAPYPLCEKVQYCAGDYVAYGGQKKSYFAEYIELLSSWCDSIYSHPKAIAVMAYVKKKNIVKDLIGRNILFLGQDQKLLTGWADNKSKPEIFRLLIKKDSKHGKGLQDQGDVFIRWIVESPENQLVNTWDDHSLFESWMQFYLSQESGRHDVCLVSGGLTSIANKHPAKIRGNSDTAKLISSNDSKDYTYRGRFTDDNGFQACTISAEVTQKAHNALSWLIERQGCKIEDKTFISWAKTGDDVPDLMLNSYDFLLGVDSEEMTNASIGDAGQSFAKRLSRKILGYQANIKDTSSIVILGLDSATPGRMAVIFYRELEKSEFLQRIKQWHDQFSWYQNYSINLKDSCRFSPGDIPYAAYSDNKSSRVFKFSGAPAPKDIAEAVFARWIKDSAGNYVIQIDKSAKKVISNAVERILPCIVDGSEFPRDLLQSIISRTSNRIGMNAWEWEKLLGIACSLYKGANYHKERFFMGLDENRDTRDYLYGRLLAVVDYLEELALIDAEQNRPTNAARLMQRFSTNPATTWLIIHNQVRPYVDRLRSNPKRVKRLNYLVKLIENIKYSFKTVEEFNDDKTPLSGEYLLAYYCQRKELWKGKADVESDRNESEN